MSEAIVKYRRPLNSEQVAVLRRLFNYRFSTSKQIAQSLGKSSNKAIQNKLQILEEQGFIGKRYDKSYKLQGRPAEYHLTPKGARQLEKLKPNSIAPAAVKILYKNKTVSQDFIAHCVRIGETAQQLQQLYGDGLETFTKSELAGIDCFPTWTPDMFLNLQYDKDSDDWHHYFLDVWDGTKPFFTSVRKARNYVNYDESGEWPQEHSFPGILAICEDEKMQKKLNRQLRRILEDAWNDKLIFATTTKQQLQAANKPTEEIWSNNSWDGELKTYALHSLFVDQ